MKIPVHTNSHQAKLIRHLAANHPEKLKFNPKVIEITETHIIFGLSKHMGRIHLELGKSNCK